MQGKALAGLLPLALAALLIGCGGEDGEEGSAAKAEGAASPARAEGAAAPADGESRLQRLKDRIEEAKRRKEKQQAQSAEGQSDSPPVAPPPEIDHDDSGGGAAQFRSKGGDNSIQDFGTEASDSERERVATALHAYLDSRAARQWATACSYMSAQIKQSLERLAAGAGQTRGCAQILAALSKDVPQRALDDAAVADVGSLRADGNRGFILYHGARDADYAMPMVTEGGAWKVSAIEGSPLL